MVKLQQVDFSLLICIFNSILSLNMGENVSIYLLCGLN